LDGSIRVAVGQFDRAANAANCKLLA
jgi:hypothetical protein